MSLPQDSFAPRAGIDIRRRLIFGEHPQTQGVSCFLTKSSKSSNASGIELEKSREGKKSFVQSTRAERFVKRYAILLSSEELDREEKLSLF